jgi:chitin synthase
MRYSAATCEPPDFESEGFRLRQQLYGERRHTEMFIVITLYNEDEVSVATTLHGVMKNIAYLCAMKDSEVWNTEAWKKVVVCVIADGRTKYDLSIP